MNTPNFDEAQALQKLLAVKLTSRTGYVCVDPITLEVTIDGSISFAGSMETTLPCKFEHISGDLICTSTSLVTLRGAPRILNGALDVVGCKDLSSFEHFPETIHKSLHMCGTKMDSLHNIHKHIKFIGNELVIGTEIRSRILGVLAIKGLKSVRFNSRSGHYPDVVAIINKHLADGRDILLCQEELIEAGFSGYARL